MKLRSHRKRVTEKAAGVKDPWEPQENFAKARQVFLYVVGRKQDEPGFDHDFLEKLLYFIDFDHYEKNEVQLMGLRWFKGESGPIAPQVETLLGELLQAGAIIRVKSKSGAPSYRIAEGQTVPQLPQEEIQSIEKTFSRLMDYDDAKSLSDFSHVDIPWYGPDLGDEIEYEAVFYRAENMSARELHDVENPVFRNQKL